MKNRNFNLLKAKINKLSMWQAVYFRRSSKSRTLRKTTSDGDTRELMKPSFNWDNYGDKELQPINPKYQESIHSNDFAN